MSSWVALRTAVHDIDLDEAAWADALFSEGQGLLDTGLGLFAASSAVDPARRMDRTVGFPLVLGRGFSPGWFWPHPYGWWRTGRCFGHAGNFGTLAWADPTTGCAIAAVTNGNRRPTTLVTRFAGIGIGLRAACVD